MTVFGRDASNFDGTIDYSGLTFFTHKATEGTSITHDRYAARLNAARAAGVPVLGSYHVLRSTSPLAAQLTYWVNYLDGHTPWWRSFPYWIMQIDAEKWPYDAVSALTVKNFAALVQQSGLPGFKITYASRGQYGDSLAGIVTPLWNANYSGGPSYPGDSWSTGWQSYSGRVPAILQYTSTPYDKNAFRGTLAQLKALIAPESETDMAVTASEISAIAQGVASKLNGDLRDQTTGIGGWVVANRQIILDALQSDQNALLAAIRAGVVTIDPTTLAAALAPLLNEADGADLEARLVSVLNRTGLHVAG